MTEKKYCVYLHTSPSNKYYVGITSQAPEGRWGKGGFRYKRNHHFWNAIQKYGWNNFKHEIIFENLTENEAKAKEHEMVMMLKSYDSNYGYNMTEGGDTVFKPTIESRRKMSLAKKGQTYMADIAREMFSKPVKQYGLDHTYIKTWNSVSDAERALNICHECICDVCNGKLNKAGGYYWSYVGNKPLFRENHQVRPVKQIDLVTGKIINIFPSMKSAGNKLHINYKNIQLVCVNKRNKAGGYGWEYVA